MSKKIIFSAVAITLLLTFCVSFNSCEKEGVYNPKQKMSKVYQDFVHTCYEYNPQTGEVIITEKLFPKQLTQTWTWDKNKLNKIDFWDFYYWHSEEPESEIWYTDRYFYEKNQLVRIERDGGYYIEITYDGSKYKKINFYDNRHKPWLSMDFTYDKNKISNIVIIEMWENYWDKATEGKFLSTFLPKEFVSKMVNKSEKKRAKKFNNTATYNVNYTYTGDNINEMIFQYIDEDEDLYKITAKYISYDSKQNPFYKKFGIDIESELFVFGNLMITPKNNPLEVNFTLYEEYYGEPDTENMKFQYTYTYSKDFPTEVQLKVIDMDGDAEIAGKVYYEYK
ncbi:MAG: hypothetical protein FWC41_14240 [Firmicutes bacterium]|nr:hypothetical protein [Bacillota bacterium]